MDKRARMIEAIKKLREIDLELFYPALALWDMCGKEEPTEEEVDKAIRMLGDADTIYDDVLREDVRNEFGFYDEEE